MPRTFTRQYIVRNTACKMSALVRPCLGLAGLEECAVGSEDGNTLLAMSIKGVMISLRYESSSSGCSWYFWSWYVGNRAKWRFSV